MKILKILIPHSTGENIYVRELGRSYERLGHSVIYGSENLLEKNTSADLVHLQWPEEQYRWRGDGPIAARVQKLFDALGHIRQLGAKIAWTIHNIVPHDHVDSDIDKQVYQYIIYLADTLVHHCEKSQLMLSQTYDVPKGKNSIVVPHGNYFSYPNTVSELEARGKLGIPLDAFVYLHFGQIRGYKGIGKIIKSFDKISVAKKYLLIAGKYENPPGYDGFLERLKLKFKKIFYKNFQFYGKPIPSMDIQIYLNACNCVVLGHTSGLNSGVAILGMSFGRTIIGPRIGCIDWVLDLGENIVYPSGDINAMTDALQEVSISDYKLNGLKNREIAKTWEWINISTSVIKSVNIN